MATIEQALSISLKNVLLATDLSPVSETALKYARAIARERKAELHAIHVVSPSSYQLLQPEALAVSFRELENSEDRATDIVQSLFNGLPSYLPLQQGEIWNVIGDVVRRNKIDLLVLGTHGRKGISKLFQGSVAEEIFRNVSCPVLTVGPDVQWVSKNGLHIGKILLASHFEPRSAAPAYAGWLAREFHAELAVLHVASDTGMGKKRQLIERLRSLFPEEVLRELEPEFLAEYGAPSTKILEIADRIVAGLIVLGARHRKAGNVNTHVPWATAARIISEANCPVLTVRQPEG